MEILNEENYNSAVAAWKEAKEEPNRISELLPPNFIFNLSTDQIEWLKGINKNNEFCVEMGVYEERLILILCSLDKNGNKINTGYYPYSYFERLERDLKLTEIQTFKVVKHAVLSKDMRKIENDSDLFFPITEKPIMEQDKAIAAIDLWEYSGMDWFYEQYTSGNSQQIFNKFYVPSQKIYIDYQGLNFVCLFGLKFSEIYQKILPTLIFIAFENHLTSDGTSTISNTYDWAKPCPPICKIPDLLN